MARGPRGEKRPADVIGTAVLVGRIATGEAEDTTQTKNPNAVALGRLGGSKGGKARAKAMSASKRKAAARRAATARWSKTAKT